tara:strand:- start:31939 stop:32952 length:1014 start_codon:yes stop_codon:yes gene_type:complete
MCETYARIGLSEPNTTFYSKDDCGGTSAVGKLGYNVMFNTTPIGKDNLNSLVIAPHHTVTLGSHTLNGGPDGRSDRMLKIANDIQFMNRLKGIAPIGEDNADWYRIDKRKSWDQWKVDACTGKETDRTGFFAPSNSACDQVMSSYCNQSDNRSKEVCGCFGSEIPNPSCHDIRCSASFNAYKTKAMYDTINAGCPTYLDCRQYLNIAEGAKNNVLNNVYQQQLCIAPDTGPINNNTDVSGGVPKPTPVPPGYTPGPSYPSPGTTPSTPTYTPQKESFFSPMVIGLIILIFVVLFAMIIAVAMSGDDEPKRRPVPGPQYGPPVYGPQPQYVPMPQQFR